MGADVVAVVEAVVVIVAVSWAGIRVFFAFVVGVLLPIFFGVFVTGVDGVVDAGDSELADAVVEPSC